jgi:nucleotide-binding universal stress UspA family protein
MASLRTILHPTDFSERSRQAFELAGQMARAAGARLIVLHVTRPADRVRDETPFPPDPDLLAQAARAELVRLAAPAALDRAEGRLREGDPVTEILRAAREIPADLIVMGTRRRTGLGRLLLGSVAEQVVRRAPCPVLTVNRHTRILTPPGTLCWTYWRRRCDLN